MVDFPFRRQHGLDATQNPAIGHTLGHEREELLVINIEKAKTEPHGRAVGKRSICETEASLDACSTPDEIIIQLVISRVVGHKSNRREEAKQR